MDSSDLPDDSLEQRVIGEPAPTDKLARAVARSKIAAALFAKESAVTVGRYRLLEQVGSGGMGVVWGAWDPELERRVAIKVVKPELASARERIVREGQALAKLSHPHVVPIYDVGVVDDQVYLVMEWVRGETLHTWAKQPRAVRDIVRAYREAAIGLAAAHEVGLVHRDFKPDNAMLGADGRVRVLDFGLAREGGAGAGVAGTPKYMAPDAELTPAADQYSLGVALREALGEPPAWLAAIIARATATRPADRYPSMQALVDALGRDPARVWRRRIAVAAAVALAGVAFAIGIRAGTEVEERCGGGRAEIATDWNATARASVAAHLRELGPYGADLAKRAGDALDTYATRWALAHATACRAHDRGELTPAIYTANVACLTRARIALSTARDVLSTTKRERLPETFVAVQSLPAVERCRLGEDRPPPAAIASKVTAIANDVARARVLALAVDPRAIEAGAGAARAADALGYPPLIGHASLVHGLALLLQQKRADATVAFEHATSAALEANDTSTAIEALARHVFAIATANTAPANTDKTLASIDTAIPIAKGTTDPFARALFYNNLGTLRLARDDRKVASTWFEEAERVRPPPSKEHYELASIEGNRGLVETEPTRRDALFAREGAELEAALGADHPFTIEARVKAAMFVDDTTRSTTILRDACDRYRRMHPHLVEKIAGCAYEVLWFAEARGDVTEARAWVDAVGLPRSPEGRIAAGYRLLLDGKPADAAREMTATADSLATDKALWSRWRAIDARIVAAVAAEQAGDHASAAASYDQSLAAIDALGDFATSSFVQRRRARVRAKLDQR